jgi:hypothetical protein
VIWRRRSETVRSVGGSDVKTKLAIPKQRTRLEVPDRVAPALEGCVAHGACVNGVAAVCTVAALLLARVRVTGVCYGCTSQWDAHTDVVSARGVTCKWLVCL